MKFKINQQVYFVLMDDGSNKFDIFNPVYPLPKVPIYGGNIERIHIEKNRIEYDIVCYNCYNQRARTCEKVPENLIADTEMKARNIFYKKMKKICGDILHVYKTN